MLARIAVLVSLLAPACRMSLEDGTSVPVDSAVDGTVDAPLSPSCAEAPNHSELAWIEENVFRGGCTASSCHDGVGNRPEAMMDLTVGNSHTSLVAVASKLEAQYQLVVAGEPTQSYLLMMIQQISPDALVPPTVAPPEDPGFMPQANPPLCAPKLAAVQRWIEQGAQNN